MSKGQKLSPFQHAYKRPGTYIGSVVTSTQEVYLLRQDGVRRESVKFNTGLFNIIREIGSNTLDNYFRSEDTDTPTKKISMHVNKPTGRITITNDGLHIPVELTEYEVKNDRTGKTSTETLYPAEMFFGDMLAGTNFDDDEKRKTSGQNGMGGKAANVFSTVFEVVCADPVNKKIFEQIYTKNGSSRQTPTVKSFRAKNGYTKISFIPDYEYFSFPSTTKKKFGITDDFIDVLKLYAAELSLAGNGVRVEFKVESSELAEPVSQIFSITNLEKYAKLWYPGITASKYVYVKGNLGDCLLLERPEDTLDDSLETGMNHRSFVNGILTKDGGIHTNAWGRILVGGFVKKYNEKLNRGKATGKVSANMVYPYIQIFVKLDVDNPVFTTQTKEQLSQVSNNKKYSPVPNGNGDKSEFDAAVAAGIKKMSKWSFITRLRDTLSVKEVNSLKRKEGAVKSKVRLDPNKGREAIKAGTAESKECTLYITEGDSAKAFAMKGIGTMPNGWKYNGVLAIQGKLPNVSADKKAYGNNKEIQNIKELLGLRLGVKYSTEAERSTLRYGRLCLLTDQDDDGFHIRGLLLNLIYVYFPALIKAGFVICLNTAVAVAIPVGVRKKRTVGTDKQGKQVFYSNPELSTWLETCNHKVRVNYFKGLASINPKDTPEYFSSPKIVSYFLGKHDADAMKKAFEKNKGDSDTRKDMLTSDVVKEFVYEGQMHLSDFVYSQLIIFFKLTLGRSLPSFCDGNKVSQRKILFGIFSKNYKYPDKVSKVSGAIQEATPYHHGDASLHNTIVNMAQNYTGSNNINLLEPDGEFGTRACNGADHGSARYIKTMLSKMAHVVFQSVDEALYIREREDGDLGEYTWYLPVVPILLINGCRGIATGWASRIPSFNPTDIVTWLKKWMTSKKRKPLKPWYRGFTGEINLIECENEDMYKWECIGRIDHLGGAKYRITEIPVEVKFAKVVEHLQKLEYGDSTKKSKQTEKPVQLVKNIQDESTVDTPCITFTCVNGFTPDIATNFGVLKTTNTLNFVVLDRHSRPKRYTSPEEYLEEWCTLRLKYYSKRRDHLLKTWGVDLVRASNKFRFVSEVVDHTLDLNQPKNIVDNVLRETGYDLIEDTFDYLLSMQMRSMTVEKLAELKRELDTTKEKIDVLESKTASALWLEDLELFETEYVKYLETFD